MYCSMIGYKMVQKFIITDTKEGVITTKLLLLLADTHTDSEKQTKPVLV